jgi:hypothetical protein
MGRSPYVHRRWLFEMCLDYEFKAENVDKEAVNWVRDRYGDVEDEGDTTKGVDRVLGLSSCFTSLRDRQANGIIRG